MKVDTVFIETLTQRLEGEYQKVLRPIRLEEYIKGLVHGKYMRSKIAFMLSDEVSEELYSLCVALELLHTSSLVHDDIIDNAPLRRGYTTIYSGAGGDQAILVGNMLATRAFEIALSVDVNVARKFLEAYQSINRAQEMEIIFRGDTSKTIEECLGIYAGKTSAMIELPAWIAESISKKTFHELVPALKNLGLAFQVIDDIEDLQAWLIRDAGEDKRDKSADFDIELGDYTLPALYVLNNTKTVGDNWYEDISAKVWDEAIKKAYSAAGQYIHSAKDILKDKGHVELLEWVEDWEHRVPQGIEVFMKIK